VKYAAQVLSATVAAAMSLSIRFGFLPASASGTVEFVERIDKLFDLFNSSTTSTGKKYNRAFKGLDYQINFLKECYEFFENVKVINHQNRDITNNIKCLKGWKVSINGLIELWDILKGAGYQYVFTRRLNQDCLENLFGSIRQKSGNNFNPTPIQFFRSFKTLFCINILNSGTENCQEDHDQVLLKISDMPEVTEPQDPNQIVHETQEPVIDHDYQNCDILQKNFARYICGYLIKKCLSVHTCDVCLTFAKGHDTLDDTTLFCYFKAYENASADAFGNLQMPDDSFVFFFAMLEGIFQNSFEELVLKRNILKELLILYNTVAFKHPCINFPYNYVIKLYARIRLFYTLKFANRNFKIPNRNRKLIIWRHQ
jgi:hypothetical protein